VVILLAYFITNAIIRFGAFLFVITKYPPNKNKEKNSETLTYGKKLSIFEIINVASSSLDNILVFHYLGAIELAAYAFIKKVPENIKLLPRYITQLSVPKFSKQDIGDPLVKKEVARKTWFFAAGTAAVVFAYILLAPFIFNLLFAPYKEYVFYSQIYALSFAFNFGGLFLNFVETNRKAGKVLSLHLTTSIFTIVVVFASLKFYGLLGLVAGYSVTRFVSSLIRYAYFKRATK
jgi:O-antigen/teichoic acid export membrane protein